jgi:tryptophanyl-tRNA synthetase
VAKRKRVLSGMRPTGPLHIGHYFGALANWVKMQEEYDCFYFVADWHALTTDYADTSQVRHNTREIATDWLAAGLDPAKCTMFVQSRNLEHGELHLLLSMITPLSWLERVPTYKEQLENITDKDLHTYGFLGYPLLQSADIVIYDADFVPVGEDQVPHVELTREIVRRFNAFYGLEVDRDKMFAPENFEAADSLKAMLSTTIPSLLIRPAPFKWTSAPGAGDVEWMTSSIRRLAAEIGVKNFLEQNDRCKPFIRQVKVLQEPMSLLTQTPRLLGTDGRKMSKSYGNAIELGESDESIREKTRVMMTDPARRRREDPGNPDVCPVFSWHKLFSTPETIAWSDQGCRTAGIGCIECKAAMAEGLIKWITPIRERRKEYEADPRRVEAILAAGSKKAHKVARQTMRRVREAIFGSEEIGRAKRARPAARQAAQGS